MEVKIQYDDQRLVSSLHHGIHQYDQRSSTLENRSVTVGIVPMIAQERERALSAEAFQAVSSIQDQARQFAVHGQSEIHQAQNFSRSIEHRAHDLVSVLQS